MTMPSARRPWVAAALTDHTRLLSQALRAAQDGLIINLDWLLTDDQQQALSDYVTAVAELRGRGTAPPLPPGILREHIQLYLELRPQ